MKKIGVLKSRTSKQIKGSRIGIGFECLDRKMWNDTEEAYRLTGELGVKHARVQTGWCRCEREPGIFDFAWLDRIVDKLLSQGVQPWFNLGYGNIHHTGATEPDAVGWAPIHSESEKTAWTAYVAALVQHFRGRVTHYEIWNEPDINPFWIGGPDPLKYMALVKLTAAVIRRHDPAARIIGGATAGGTNLMQVECYLKEGLADLIDVYSYHRYHVHPELHRADEVAALRASLNAHGGGHIQLWQAESGCPSVPSATQALANVPVSEELQARVLARSLLSDLIHGLDYTSYFHLSDFKFYYRNGFCEKPNFFGLLTFDDPPRCKSAYRVMQNICALFDDDTILNPRQSLGLWSSEIVQSERRYAYQELEISTCRGLFTRGGHPLMVWWQPANLLPEVSGDQPFQPLDISAHIWSPEHSVEQPVVVDVMTGEVFEPVFERYKPRDNLATGNIELKHVPLKQTPMLATDRRAIADVLALDAINE